MDGSNQRQPYALNNVEQYRDVGGLHWGPVLREGLFGYCRATWPLVTLVITPEKVTITVTSFTHRRVYECFEFEKHELTCIRLVRGLLTPGIVFEHSKSDYPTLLRFYSFKRNRLVQELRRFGYQV